MDPTKYCVFCVFIHTYTIVNHNIAYIFHDNNLMQYNNACIQIMSGFNVGPEKVVPPQQRPPAL